MSLVFCKPDITPRQELWGLMSEVNELKHTLFECCLYDTRLMLDAHYSAAVTALGEAVSHMAHLRGKASGETFTVLSENVNTISDLISQNF